MTGFSGTSAYRYLCTPVLARAENPTGARFERKGTPDAGVECYSILQDGSEWGWQAKYFNDLRDSQWSQLDKSIKTALDKHPALVRYFICIPLNRSDARVAGRMSAMQRWDVRIKKWKGWMQERGMKVDFVWWGSSELLDRLSRGDHIGRRYFWFGEYGFDDVWFKARLDESLKAAGPRYTPDAQMVAMLRTLDTAAQQAWESYVNEEDAVKEQAQILWLRKLSSTIGGEEPSIDGEAELEEAFGHDDPEMRNEKALRIALEAFMTVLTPQQRTKVASILELRKDRDRERPPRFDLKLIQRYVLWRVFDLGWKTERFGRFDRFSIHSYGREASKPERIGKKYQWIAYHEILAYIADHYQYVEQYREDEGNQAYDRPWQESLRDIDPSCTLLSTPGGTRWGGHKSSWWGPTEYSAWAKSDSPQDWIAREHDIPDVTELLVLTHPDEGSCWVNVQGHFNWRQQYPADVESTDVDRRDIWFTFTGYFLRTEDVASFMNWAKGVNLMEGRMPDPPETHWMNLGEYAWSPAFRYFNQPYFGADGWVQPGRGGPVFVRTAAFKYRCDSNDFDCSMDDSYLLSLPAFEFIEELGLKWAGRGADYVDLDSKLAAFDPTVHEDGPNALLLRDDLVRRYCSEADLALCWTVIGEKRVLGGGCDRKYQGALRISGAYVLEEQGPEEFLNFHRDRLDVDARSDTQDGDGTGIASEEKA